ncbi:MAG: NifU family protein [Actinomycetota bacterium]|nr:NifU family protein [Actinomycetota bacterium]
MPTLDDLLTRLEHLLAQVEELDEQAREPVLELLDGLDALHRLALARLPAALGADGVARLRQADPALAWLLDAYGVALDERAAAERALDEVRPYLRSHGGEVEVRDARDGVVRVRLTGTCSGCTASAITLTEGVERALRDGLPGFAALHVEDDGAAPHPPPAATLLQIESRL